MVAGLVAGHGEPIWCVRRVSNPAWEDCAWRKLDCPPHRSTHQVRTYVPASYLCLVSVPDRPLSLYQTDPCLCTRLTLVSIPEMFLCWFSVLVAGIVTYLDANRTVQVRRRYACPYTTVFKSIYVVDYGNTAVLIESVGKTVGSLILQVFVPSF